MLHSQDMITNFCVCFFAAVPGAVTRLTVAAISSAILQLSWGPPTTSNGAILFYSIVVYANTHIVFETSVSGDGQLLTQSVGNLGKCVCV